MAILIDEPDFDAAHRGRSRLLELHEELGGVARDTMTGLVDPLLELTEHRDERPLFMDQIGRFARRRHPVVEGLVRAAIERRDGRAPGAARAAISFAESATEGAATGHTRSLGPRAPLGERAARSTT